MHVVEWITSAVLQVGLGPTSDYFILIFVYMLHIYGCEQLEDILCECFVT